jgi:hypothetical protein
MTYVGAGRRKKILQRIWIHGLRGLIAQLSHQHHQIWRHSNGLLAQTDDKPFTDFLAERRVMDAADLNVTLVRGINHEISDLLAT